MTDLGFQALAEEQFGFLVTEKGYTWAESTPSRVRFESPQVFIDLIFDAGNSYQLGLLVGRKGAEGPPFRIDEILRLRHAPEATSFELIQVTTGEALALWLGKLAGALRTYGDDFIAGNERSFEEVAGLRHAEVREYALERELRAARADADAAWHRKDYAAVIEAFEPVRALLTPGELAKLEFAEKHRTH